MSNPTDARLALTLRHPWPFAVCYMGKDIENRTWPPGRRLRLGDWFFIHGGKAPTARDDVEDMLCTSRELLRRFGPPPGMTDVTGHDIIRCSGLVAVAEFGGAVRRSDSPWFDPPNEADGISSPPGYGWRLQRVIVLPKPVPCRGAQGLWVVPPDLLSVAMEQVDAALSVLPAN